MKILLTLAAILYAKECPLNSYEYGDECECFSGFYKVEAENYSINSIGDAFSCVPEEKAAVHNNSYSSNSYSMISTGGRETYTRSLITFYEDYLSITAAVFQSNIFIDSQRGSMASVALLLSAGQHGLAASYEYTRFFGNDITSHIFYLGHLVHGSFGVGGALVEGELKFMGAAYVSLPSIDVIGVELYPTLKVSGIQVEDGTPVEKYDVQAYKALVILDIGVRYVF